jgi:hypothetical protein
MVTLLSFADPRRPVQVVALGLAFGAAWYAFTRPARPRAGKR